MSYNSRIKSINFIFQKDENQIKFTTGTKTKASSFYRHKNIFNPKNNYLIFKNILKNKNKK